MTKLEEQLIKHEGYRKHPYIDTVGKLTVAIGRNLDDVGITKEEAVMLLRSDLKHCEEDLAGTLPWFQTLDPVRQDALMNMCFNLGIVRLTGFKNMLEALKEGRYHDAAREALDSKWAKQVGKRADDISHMIRNGEYPDV